MPLADKRISIKKEQILLYSVHNILSLGKMDGKAEPFHEDQLKMNLQSSI